MTCIYCPYYGNETKYCYRYKITKEPEKLCVYDTEEWIPVTEQTKPKFTGIYLVTIKDNSYPKDSFFNEVEMWAYDSKTEKWAIENFCPDEADRVLAWRVIKPYIADEMIPDKIPFT